MSVEFQHICWQRSNIHVGSVPTYMLVGYSQLWIRYLQSPTYRTIVNSLPTCMLERCQHVCWNAANVYVGTLPTCFVKSYRHVSWNPIDIFREILSTCFVKPYWHISWNPTDIFRETLLTLLLDLPGSYWTPPEPPGPPGPTLYPTHPPLRDKSTKRLKLGDPYYSFH